MGVRLEFFPLPFVVGTIFLVILLIILWQRKRNWSYLFCFSLFWMYLLFVISATAFPIPLPSGAEELQWRLSAAHILSRMNLRLFYFGGLFSLHPNVIFQEIIGNIIMTIPFGFGLSFVAPIKAKSIAWLAPTIGILIETTQLIIALGIGASYRGVDINDVILNALGVLIGYGLFRIFAWFLLKMAQQSRINPKGFLAYIRFIANQTKAN